MSARVLALLPVMALLSACATAPPPQTGMGVEAGHQHDPGQTSEADLEALYAAAMGRAGLTVRVNSNGCTKKADFQVQVLDGWPAPTVIFKRMRQDMCRALVAGGVELLFGYEELGVKPNGQIVLANPLTSDPTPGR